MHPWKNSTSPGPGSIGGLLLLAIMACLIWQIVPYLGVDWKTPLPWIVVIGVVAFSIWGATCPNHTPP